MALGVSGRDQAEASTTSQTVNGLFAVVLGVGVARRVAVLGDVGVEAIGEVAKAIEKERCGADDTSTPLALLVSSLLP